MTIDSKVCIYGLVDPRTNHYRYIGRTLYPKKRLQAQTNMALSNKHKTRVHTWIRSLLDIGLKPIQIIIEIVPERRWIEAERYWIDYFKNVGYLLLNMVAGGEGAIGRKASDGEKQKRSVAMKMRYEDPNERLKTSIAVTKAYEKNPGLRIKQSTINKKRYENPKEREKSSVASQKRWNTATPEQRKQHRDSTIKALNSPEYKENARQRTTERYKDPKEREKTSIAVKKAYENNSDLRKKMSVITKLKWQDPDFKKKQSDGLKKYWAKKKRLGIT